MNLGFLLSSELATRHTRRPCCAHATIQRYSLRSHGPRAPTARPTPTVSWSNSAGPPRRAAALLLGASAGTGACTRLPRPCLLRKQRLQPFGRTPFPLLARPGAAWCHREACFSAAHRFLVWGVHDCMPRPHTLPRLEHGARGSTAVAHMRGHLQVHFIATHKKN